MRVLKDQRSSGKLGATKKYTRKTMARGFGNIERERERTSYRKKEKVKEKVQKIKLGENRMKERRKT